MKHFLSFRVPPASVIAMLLFLPAFLACLSIRAQNDSVVTIQQILDAHNAFRREVGVPPLVWSEELAGYAKEWASELATNRECKMEHRPFEEGNAWKQLYGENIYSGGGSDWKPTILDAVGAWGEEKKNFNLANKDCPDGSCGHYTQMIWKNTTTVGCAVVVCPDGNVIVVCNYDPSGNWSGETPF